MSEGDTWLNGIGFIYRVDSDQLVTYPKQPVNLPRLASILSGSAETRSQPLCYSAGEHVAFSVQAARWHPGFQGMKR